MSVSSTEGIVGSVVLVAIFWVAYLIATKKSSWNLLPEKGMEIPENWKEKYGMWLLVVAGAAVFFWGLYTPELRLSQVGSWSWNHWLSLSAFLGIIFVLIALNAKALGATAKPLGSMLTGVAFMLFIGFPVWFGVRDAVLPSRLCPNGSANEIRECKVNTAWPYWIEGDTGTTPGFLLCFDGPVEPDSAIMNGRSVYRFRAYEGESLVSYKFKEKCGGPL